MMAEGGYDPTTENETPWEDHGIDHDDDDEEVNTTQPFQPGASSTPYHGGEEHEIANMDPEEEGAWRHKSLSLPNTTISCTLKTRKPLWPGSKLSSKLSSQE